MKAVIRHVYGPPDVMELAEVEKPAPGEGELLIRVHATALNASDHELLTGVPLYGRMFGFFTPKVRILGSDIAGTVEAVGPGVTGFAVGEAVYGDTFERCGGFAEHVCVPVKMMRAKPAALSFEQAAALPQSGVIALQAIRDDGKLQAGEKVLINGAGGGGGSYAIQIAKAVGAEVTAVDSAEKLELMRSLGADSVVDYSQEDVTRNGQQYDLILDLVGGHAFTDFKRALAPEGRYFIVGGPMKLLLAVVFRGALGSLFGSKKMKILTLKTNHGLELLEDYIASGALRPAIDRTFPLHETPDALRYIGAGRAKGKVVITVDSDSRSATPPG